MAAEYIPLFAPVVIEAGVNDKIVFHDGVADRTATVAPARYFLRGDGTPEDLAKAVADALDGAPGSLVPDPWEFLVSLDTDAAKISASVTLHAGMVFTLKKDGSSFDFEALGFDFAATYGGSEKYVESNVTPSCVWVPTDIHRALRPRYFSRAVQTITRSGVVRTARLSSQRVESTLSEQNIDGRRVHADENTGDPNAAFSTFLDRVRDGRMLELAAYQLTAGQTKLNPSTRRPIGLYHLGPAILETFDPQRLMDGLSLWSWDIDLRKHVSAS